MSQKILFKESFLYASGNILQKLGDFVFIPIFTYYLTLEEYGSLSLCLSIVPLSLLLLQQGTRTGFLRLYYDYEENRRESLYTTVLLYNIVAGAVLVFVVFLFRSTFNVLLTDRMTFFPVGILILSIAFTNNLFQINLAYLQVKHRAGFYVAYSLLCFFCRYGLIVGLITLMKMGLNGYLAGYLGANIILVLLPNLIYLIKRKFTFSTDYLMPLLTFSLPVVPHLVSMWVYNLSSRVIVERYVSTEDYAIFSLGANIAAAFSVLVTSFSLAWGPHYLKIATQQSHKAAKILKKNSILVLKLFSVLFVGFSLFSRELVLVAGRNEIYHSAYKVIPFILLGYFFMLMYILMIAGFYLRKETFFLSLISVSTGLFSILSLIFCSKYYGIEGASVAMAINYLVLCLLVAYFSNRMFPIAIGKILLLAGGMNTVFVFLIDYLNKITGVTIKSSLLKACLLWAMFYITIGRKYIRSSTIRSDKYKTASQDG